MAPIEALALVDKIVEQGTSAALFTVTGAPAGPDLACTDDPELFFAVSPQDVEAAKALCQGCRIRIACLEGALERREPWGVWGGELLLSGVIVPRKRPHGRPRKVTADEESRLTAATTPSRHDRDDNCNEATGSDAMQEVSPCTSKSSWLASASMSALGRRRRNGSRVRSLSSGRQSGGGSASSAIWRRHGTDSNSSSR